MDMAVEDGNPSPEENGAISGAFERRENSC
jgi:hypothetical protein